MRLRGELDITSAGAARRALELLEAGVQQIVLDLSDITCCDAAGGGSSSPPKSKRAPQAGTWLSATPAGPCGVLTITGELSAFCPANSPADEEPQPADLCHPVTANSSPPEAHSRMICAPVHRAPQLDHARESALGVHGEKGRGAENQDWVDHGATH